MNSAAVRKFQKACYTPNYSRGSLKMALRREAYRDARSR